MKLCSKCSINYHKVVDYANATIEIAIIKILLKNGFMQFPFE